MRSRQTFQRSLIGILCALGFLAAAPAARAANGQFTVASCQSDGLSYSTRPFVPRATLGMRIRIACPPEGKDPRGLILANNVRAGKVKYKAFAALVMYAPPGTVFKKFTWGGYAYRSDCGYEMQVWAEGPSLDPVGVKNYRAKRGCKRVVAHAATATITKNIPGATKIVIRTLCYGIPKGSACSARRSNYLQTLIAKAVIQDLSPPAVAIRPDTPLALGRWVNGHQPLNYDATDNVGIRSAQVLVAGANRGFQARSCNFAVPGEIFSAAIPCPNGPGQLDVDTDSVPEGTQSLSVAATDPAGNTTSSASIPARIDKTAPGRVGVDVQNGDGWRNSNSFAVAWSNPPEPDRAPIVAAIYKLCPAAAGNCISGQQTGDGISGLGLQVPGPGEWRLSLWRQDAAGNQNPAVASDPVVLRFDPDPPQLAFEPTSPADPTVVTVDAVDKVSGVASGSIEISQNGSGVWQELPTQIVGDRMVARFDDAVLPAGGYVFRAHATDQAHNESSTDLRVDGQPMALALPVRVVTGVQAAFRTVRTIVRRVRRHGRRVRVQHRTTVMKPTIRARFGQAVQVIGRVTNAAGAGIAGQQIAVLSSSSISPEHPIRVVVTDRDGGFAFTASSNSSQSIRFSFAGSPLMLPSQASIAMTVPALTSMRVNRTRLRNGQTVTFSGSLHTLPAPPAGKLLELQVLLPKGWETFRTIRTDPAGRWTARYHFTRTYGVQHYRFRARLPEEAGYPFADGGSHALTVEVRGRR